MADRYKLADPTTSFYDAATGFSVTCDEVAEIGSQVGEKTKVAIKAGRLEKTTDAVAPPSTGKEKPNSKASAKAPAKDAPKK